MTVALNSFDYVRNFSDFDSNDELIAVEGRNELVFLQVLLQVRGFKHQTQFN